MRSYLRTRGRTTDYSFLGASPAKSWWSAFRDSSSFERPTFILLVDNEGFRCYVGGIPSLCRRDRVESVIRYSVVLEGGIDVLASAREHIDNLTHAFLEVAAGNANSDLSRVLDQHFDESDVELLMRSQPGAAAASEVSTRLDKVWRALRTPAFTSAIPATTTNGLWSGSISSSTARAEFSKNVRGLLNAPTKNPQLAAYLNLLESPDEAGQFLSQYISVILLHQGSGEPRTTRPASTAARPASPPRVEAKPSTRGPSKYRNGTMLALLLLLLCCAAVWYFGSRPAPAA